MASGLTIRAKWWLYVTGILAELIFFGYINWAYANPSFVLLAPVLTFLTAWNMGRWYTRELREARERGECL